ncbi:hypothetical protein BGZ60DRAFT_153967 [Tricladium varicosporioides]|nr:hypothetical protein BGZ60DRAFT_153967 [Hymenoscyphus varicosporioides]
MSYQDQNSGGGYPPPREGDSRYPPPDDRQESRYPPPPGEREEQRESQYPPPPGEEDERARAYHQRGPSNSSNITLPSMNPYDSHSQYSQPQNGYGPGPSNYPQDPYRPGPGQGPYRDDRGYQQDYGRGAPLSQNNLAFSQQAPRQRTAIACRYCRRRKIRCSGFEQAPDGRCSNCCRFQQECIFTPVSSQAQAFVPAHTVFPNMRNMGIGPDGRPRPMYSNPGTQLFGAHGQPLGPIPAPQGGAQQSYSQGSQGHSSANIQYGQGPQRDQYGHPQQGSHSQDQSRKRTRQEPHPTTLPPPMPNQPPYGRSDSTGSSRRAPADDDLRLPPVTPTGAQSTSNYSPGSSTSTHSNLQPPHVQSNLPSLSRTPPPRASPGEGRSDPMSLGNIMERRPDTEIDRNMLGKLDRRGQ